MIGWYEVGIPNGLEGKPEEMHLRPVVMGSNGVATDYMNIPEGICFVGVLRNTGNVFEAAREMHKARFGTQEEPTIIQEEIRQRLPN